MPESRNITLPLWRKTLIWYADWNLSRLPDSPFMEFFRKLGISFWELASIGTTNFWRLYE